MGRMCEKHLKKKKILVKQPASKMFSKGIFAVSADANQPPGFSVSETLAPNGLM